MATQIPCIGPIRAALLIALMQTPYPFRTKRQLWTRSGLAIETHRGAEYNHVQGQLQRSIKKPLQLCGLHDLRAARQQALSDKSPGLDGVSNPV